MNETVQSALTAELSTMTRVVDVPADEPLGYGRDLSCTQDLAVDYHDVDPASTVAIAEALIRRAITPRGGLIDDPDYGFDLRGYCNRGVSADELRMLGGQLRSEFRKDDRVDDAAVTVTAYLQTSELRISATVTPADPNLAIFDFTFAVTDAAVLLTTITG